MQIYDLLKKCESVEAQLYKPVCILGADGNYYEIKTIYINSDGAMILDVGDKIEW